jgi:hypothetical protein
MMNLSEVGIYRADVNSKNSVKYNPMARKVLDPSVPAKISSGYGYGQIAAEPEIRPF